ncbi:MAG: hypothetical protein HQ517_09135 [SAR324 cluster bacterium]|nr:hypothetical protein [SAR324 cluster bacterium]
MSDTNNMNALALKIIGFNSEAAFLRFIRKQSEDDKEKIFKLLPENKYIKKYLVDRARAEAGSDEEHESGEARAIRIANEADYKKAKIDIEALFEKSPLNTPFLNSLQSERFYEPRISIFGKRPILDKDFDNDAKFLFRIINTHLTSKSSIYTKEEIEQKLASVARKRGGKKRQIETDLRSILALHIWSYTRSRALPKNKKNDLFIEALTNLCQAMYIGGFSYFNVSSFGLIHSEYVKNYKQLLEEKQKQILKNSILYDFLPVLRSHLGGIELLKKSSIFLNSRLINVFETHSLDFKLKKLYISDFKKALYNYFNHKYDKMVNGIQSKIFIFLYLDLMVYLSCIFQMDLPEKLTQYNALNDIKGKDYDISLRVHAIRIRQLLFNFYWSLSQSEFEPGKEPITTRTETDTETELKTDPSPYGLLCKIMASCNQAINEIRNKSNIDRYIEVTYYELYPLYRYYDALVNYIPNFAIDKDVKIFTINFIKNALFIKQQAIARQKEDRLINVIQKMIDNLKSVYKKRVEEYQESMIQSDEPEYKVESEYDGEGADRP